MKKALLFILICCFSCSEINNEEKEELSLGEFQGKVGETPNSGLYEELEGLAQFELDISDTTFSFIFYSSLISDTSSTKVLLKIKSQELPEEGVYDFNDIDDVSKVYSDGFSGFYLSPTVGLNKQYYSESGTMTITSSEGANGIRGNFEAVIFYPVQTDSNRFVRQYSSISGEFFAGPKNLR